MAWQAGVCPYTYGLCSLAQVSARTALWPRFAVSCPAAARRVPLDFRTHSVRQIRRDTSASWTRVARQLKPMKRHCFARCAKQAEPPPTRNRSVWPQGRGPTRNRSVWRYAVRRGMPRPERVAQTCGDTWRNRSAWRSRAAAACDRYATERCCVSVAGAADQLYGRAALRAGPCLRPTAWLPGRRRCASGSRGSPRR